MLNIIMLNVIMLNAVMLNLMAPLVVQRYLKTQGKPKENNQFKILRGKI